MGDSGVRGAIASPRVTPPRVATRAPVGRSSFPSALLFHLPVCVRRVEMSPQAHPAHPYSFPPKPKDPNNIFCSSDVPTTAFTLEVPPTSSYPSQLTPKPRLPFYPGKLLTWHAISSPETTHGSDVSTPTHQLQKLTTLAQTVPIQAYTGPQQAHSALTAALLSCGNPSSYTLGLSIRL